MMELQVREDPQWWFNDWLIKFVCVSRSFFWCFTGCSNLAYREFQNDVGPHHNNKNDNRNNDNFNLNGNRSFIIYHSTGEEHYDDTVNCRR